MRGTRLIRKVIKTVVLIRPAISKGERVVRDNRARTGDANSTRIIRSKEDMGVMISGIAATWICTKSFWFLRPTDELLSFRSGVEKSPGFQPGARRLATLAAGKPLSVGKRGLTTISRITIWRFS